MHLESLEKKRIPHKLQLNAALLKTAPAIKAEEQHSPLLAAVMYVGIGTLYRNHQCDRSFILIQSTCQIIYTPDASV